MIRTGALVLGALALALTACRPAPFGPALPSPPPAPRPVAPEGRRPAPEAACGGAPMTVRFYDAGQGLAALVTLPDGRHVLVDAGEDPARAACGDACATWHDRVMTGLRQDLGGAPIDLLWITHQHSDHLGGARAVTAAFPVLHYVDNGQSLDKALVKKTRAAAAVAHAELHVIGPGSVQVPLGEGEEVRLTAVVPKKWPCKTWAWVKMFNTASLVTQPPVSSVAPETAEGGSQRETAEQRGSCAEALRILPFSNHIYIYHIVL